MTTTADLTDRPVDPFATDEPSTLIGFRRHLRAEVVPGEAAYLFSEKGVTALSGSRIEALVPLLDGTRDVSAVLREMPPGTTREQVEDLVTRLTLAGLVTRRSAVELPLDQNALAYWDASGLDAGKAAGALAGARAAVWTIGTADSAATSAALAAAGIAVTTGPDTTADLSVVLCTDYLDPALAEVDATQRAAGRPWLLAKPDGTTVWIGPVFAPPGACWHCLTARLRSHRDAEGYVQHALGRTGPAPRATVTLPPLTTAAAGLLATEAAKWLAGYRYDGQRAVWTFDSFDLRGRHHEVRARPQCPACGDPGLVRSRTAHPVTLRSRRKGSVDGGGHRSRSPEQVLAAYRHLVSPVTGVVKGVERDRRSHPFFNAYRSGPNCATGARSLRGLEAALRVENGGKGVTPLHAEVSALCEALERHSGMFTGEEERVRGSLNSLGDQAMHPNLSQLYHERQYADRVAWNSAHSTFQYVCAPFDPDAIMNWSPVWSLTHERQRLLPTSLLWFGADSGRNPAYALADSNGNAAGSSLEDAVLQGMLEIIERDAVALWWYNRTRASQVDLNSFADPWIDELRDVYAGLGREVWVLDVTADLRVPTMVAVSRQTSGPERPMFGFGAHLDPAIALRRALTEMNQLMPIVSDAQVMRATEAGGDPDVALWLRWASLENQPYLAPADTTPKRRSDYGYRPNHDLADDVRDLRSRLENLGHEVLVLDQTRPDIALPVVKVLVPGMRHFWARFGPGRLYDVPVRLGRLDRPTAYEDLNPIPLFA